MSSKRTILITGASSGIGFAAARVMRSRGWRVLATARKAEDRARLEQDCSVETLDLELTDPQSIARCADAALAATGGRIDALFNNAAFGQVGAIEDISADHLRRQIEVNVIGTHDLTRRILPSMRANRSGRIVQCSSVLGLVAAPYRGAYCASKFALEALSDSMRHELIGSGISVSLIEPGPIRTRFVETALANFRANIDIEGSPHRDKYHARLASMEKGGKQAGKLEPEAVVERLIHAVESSRPKARYFVTRQTGIAAAAKRALPTAILDRIVSRI